jgi:hypothetical protein
LQQHLEDLAGQIGKMGVAAAGFTFVRFTTFSFDSAR